MIVNNRQIKIALSSRYSLVAEELISFANENGLDGIEYTIQSETKENLDKEFANMKKLADSGIEIRYHFQFRKVEPAHRDKLFADASVQYYKDCLDAVSKLGGKHIIVHLCLGYRNKLEEMSYEHAKENLKIVVEYARKKGIEVCLENLTFGFTNTTDRFLDLIHYSGASATIDIGHAIASPVVLNGTVTVEDFIKEVLPYVVSAHIYNIETTKHFCPDKAEDIESRIKLLAGGHSDWWLIELGDRDEILKTKGFIRQICQSL